MGTLREQERGTGVPKVVKTDVRQPGTLEKGLEGAVAEVGRVDESSALCSEDEAAGW